MTTTCQELLDAVSRRYPRDRGWIVIHEIEISRSRRLDCLALNIYPSNGFLRIGFEVKTNRADWLRELRDPEKSAPARRWVHDFYVVAPIGLVPLKELPIGWGLLEGRVVGGQVQLYLTRRPIRETPTETGAAVLCRVLRRVVDPERRDSDAKARVEADHASLLRYREKQYIAELLEARKSGFEDGVLATGGRLWTDEDALPMRGRRY
jgi:hypothetical protein